MEYKHQQKLLGLFGLFLCHMSYVMLCHCYVPMQFIGVRMQKRIRSYELFVGLYSEICDASTKIRKTNETTENFETKP